MDHRIDLSGRTVISAFSVSDRFRVIALMCPSSEFRVIGIPNDLRTVDGLGCVLKQMFQARCRRADLG